MHFPHLFAHRFISSLNDSVTHAFSPFVRMLINKYTPHSLTRSCMSRILTRNYTHPFFSPFAATHVIYTKTLVFFLPFSFSFSPPRLHVSLFFSLSDLNPNHDFLALSLFLTHCSSSSLSHSLLHSLPPFRPHIRKGRFCKLSNEQMAFPF